MSLAFGLDYDDLVHLRLALEVIGAVKLLREAGIPPENIPRYYHFEENDWDVSLEFLRMGVPELVYECPHIDEDEGKWNDDGVVPAWLPVPEDKVAQVEELLVETIGASVWDAVEYRDGYLEFPFGYGYLDEPNPIDAARFIIGFAKIREGLPWQNPS